MTDKQIIDTTKCRYNTFDGGNTQRTICTIDGCFCDCLREKECYYKQLKAKEKENKDLREDIKDIANLLDLDTGEEYNFGNIELEIKQLQAKEQECEELRGVIRKDFCSHYVLGECSQNHHNNCVGRNQCIKDLEQECEELKKVSCKFKDYCTCDTEKLKATLQEIKEIAEKHAPRCNDYANCDYECEECHLSDLKQILQKISECEVVE